MKQWEEFLEQLEKTKGQEAVDKWLRTMKVANFDARNIYLEADNSFQLHWFKEHVQAEAKARFLNSSGTPFKIHFEKKKPRKKAEEPSPEPLRISPDPLDPGMTFDTYIACEENHFSIELLKQIAPGKINPIFLFGPSGIGKTHLLHSCGKALADQGLSVFYVHAETFTQHVVKAIQRSEMDLFRAIYRAIEVLIIDDCEYFARKTATQEELFHTFNTLHTRQRQIILSGNCPPSRMEDIEPRLTSRFEWGIPLPLSPPPEETLRQILHSRANSHHFPLRDDLAAFLLTTFHTSGKSLMRSLDALLLRYQGGGCPTPEEARILLSDLMTVEDHLQITPEKITSATAAYYGIRSMDILGKSQARECALPRKLAMYLCRKKLALSYLAIGRHFARDHSTVMTSIRQIEKKKDEEDIAAGLEEIQASLT